MNGNHDVTATLNVEYRGFQSVQPVIDRLLDAGLRSATLVRGRVTAQSAWYELQITGSPDIVAFALRGGHKGADRFSRLVTSVA